MSSFASWTLTAIAAVLAVVSGFFSIEVIASAFYRRRAGDRKTERRVRVAVLVPAHNEATNIAATLSNIRAQLRAGDRLAVVADNCSDDTANLAAAEGAEVFIRSDQTKIGKGYALDWGLRCLAQEAPPDVVIVVDADCELAPFAIDRLASACERTNRPVQALYLMAAPKNSRINHQVAQFAWCVKNFVRPLGLKVLGLPCQLMGSGMAFPWKIIRSIDLCSGHIVEDLKLGLDLARAGYPPLFCPAARVMSAFPSSAEGTKTQRQRWEHGQIALIATSAIPLLGDAVLRRNFALLVLAFDLMVPPLSLFLAALTTATFASVLLALLGGRYLALTIVSGSAIGFGLTIVLAWMAYGRTALPANSLALIPAYLFMKLRHYASALLNGGASQWVRTDRS